MHWDLPLTTWVVFAALAALSVLTLTVVIFKLMQFRRMGVGRHKLGETILDDWLNGRPDEAQRKARAPDDLRGPGLAFSAGLREWGLLHLHPDAPLLRRAGDISAITSISTVQSLRSVSSVSSLGSITTINWILFGPPKNFSKIIEKNNSDH